jgi:hypothetical protein
MQYTETQLSKLIADVESEFTAHLAKAEEDFKSQLAKSESGDSSAQVEPLVKAEEEKKPEKKPEEPEAKEEPKKDVAPESKEAPAKEGEGESKAPAEEAKPPVEGEAKPPMQADASQGHDYDAEDVAHLEKMYSSMSEGERKVHHDVIAKMAKCGEMSMNKSETNTSVEVKTEIVPEQSKETDLLKAEVAAEKAKSEGLQKSLDAVSAFLTKLVEKKVAPTGKAITSLDVIAKSEASAEEKTLSKGEVDAALSKKAQDPKLEKSDRDLINAYYLSSGSINSIRHLLK